MGWPLLGSGGQRSALKCLCLISSSGRNCLLVRARRGFAQKFPPTSGGHSSGCPTELRWGRILPFYFQLLIPDTCDNDWARNWVGSIQRVHPGLFAFHFWRIRGYCENLCIQERAWQKENGKTVGPTVLFFGCRNKDQDYIYRLVEASQTISCYFSSLAREELEAWEQDGLLTLHTAFSRDQVDLRDPSPVFFCISSQAEKRYVTHCLREQGSEVWKLLDQGAHLYVCGDAKMMAKVRPLEEQGTEII